MATPTPGFHLIDQLRRLTAEPLEGSAYGDTLLGEYLARYPLRDGLGNEPDHTQWAGAWDMSLAAADVWEEKAAAVAADFDFAADGGDYKRSQAHGQMLATARRLRARRNAGSVPLVVNPPGLRARDPYAWIGNLPQEDD